MKIYLDGKFVDDADAKVSVFDHGLLYGDGVFEGIRLYGGNIFRLEEHLERLEYSAKAILLTLPLPREQLSWATCETCRPIAWRSISGRRRSQPSGRRSFPPRRDLYVRKFYSAFNSQK